MESQSFHPAQTMDMNWYNASLMLGHSTNFETYDFLDEVCNLRNTDILVVSSGLIYLSDSQKNNIKEFVRLGGQLYVQSEYLFTHSGNVAFKFLVEELGGNFNWIGQGSGQQVPMYVQNPIRDNYNTVNQLNYFWYGTYGGGDNTIKPFLKHQGKSYGFIFESDSPIHGKIVTSSDQDWIRNYSNPLLLENILKYLERQVRTGLLPAVSISSTAEESCIGEIVTFDAEILNYHPGVALQWMINGQPVVGQTATTYQTADLQDGDVVECVLQLERLCNTHQHVSNPVLMAVIVPVSEPELSIAVPATEFCADEEIFFTAVTNNGLSDLEDISYQWFVNGQPQIDSNTPIFQSSDINDQDEVSCQLSYSTLCTGPVAVSSTSVVLSIHQQVEPTIELQSNTTIVCEGMPVIFTVNGTHLGDAPTYQWLVDGTPVATDAAEFQIDNLTNGQSVSVVVSSNAPCAITSVLTANPIAIAVLPMLTPSAHIQVEENNICAGETARFVIEGNNLGLSPIYEWTVDGTVTGLNAPNFSSNTLQDGAAISCRITVNGECITTNLVEPEPVMMEVNILSTPHIEIDANMERACDGSSISFTATGEYWGPAPVFQWLVNGEEVENDSPTLEIPEIHEGYEVSVVVISDLACTTIESAEAEASPIAISPMELEIVEIAAEHCDRADGFLEVAVSGGFEPLQLEWNTGATNSYLADLKAGDYELVVTDDLGCIAKINAELEQEAAPQILMVETTPALCEVPTGSAQIILEQDSGNFQYTWHVNNGETIESSESNITLPHGQFSVEVEDEFGCVSTATFEVERHSPIEVQAGEDQVIRLGESIELDAAVNMGGDITYQWFSEKGFTCDDCEEALVQPLESSIYTVIATNEHGCSATDEVVVKVLPNKDVHIPNVFSPNGDGANDYFNAFGGTNLVSVVRLQVFDRWGAAIYDQSGINPNNESEGWNGFYRGKVMDPGVYVYVMELKFLDGSHQLVHGDVSIF